MTLVLVNAYGFSYLNRLEEESSSLADPVAFIMSVINLVSIGALVVLGIKFIGSSKGKNTFGEQSNHVFSTFFRFLILPAVLITTIMVLLMWRMGTLGGS